MTPLVLVHGFMGGSGQWDRQTPLRANRDLIAVDLPGFGLRADLPPLDRIDDFARWVLDDLSRRGVTRFDLLGHSMGGMIAQEMVHQAPDTIRKLILYGTGPVGELPGRFEPIATSMQRARDDGARATARRIAATWFRDREDADGFADCAAIAETSALPAILAGLRAMQGWSGVAHLPGIRAKTLLVWGDLDRTYPWSQIQQLWQDIPDVALAVIPGCAHAVHAEAPEIFNAIIDRFLTD